MVVIWVYKGKGIRFIVFVSTKMFTRPSFPSRHCTHRIHFNPPRDIPEQLAAYSAQALSTVLLMLGTHFSAGWTEAIWNELSCLRTDQSAPAGNWTSDLLITSLTPNQLRYFVPIIYWGFPWNSGCPIILQLLICRHPVFKSWLRPCLITKPHGTLKGQEIL